MQLERLLILPPRDIQHLIIASSMHGYRIIQCFVPRQLHLVDGEDYSGPFATAMNVLSVGSRTKYSGVLLKALRKIFQI